MSLFHHVRCVSNTTHPNLSSLLPTYSAMLLCSAVLAIISHRASSTPCHLTFRTFLHLTHCIYTSIYVYGTYNRSIMFTLHYPYHIPFQLHLVHTHKCVCIFSTTYIHIHISNQMNLRYCSFRRNISVLYLYTLMQCNISACIYNIHASNARRCIISHGMIMNNYWNHETKQ